VIYPNVVMIVIMAMIAGTVDTVGIVMTVNMMINYFSKNTPLTPFLTNSMRSL